ncbi:MAG: D-alanyl-D-alanine carboxypeptidase/D-alanyl-D-alanine-endopeptidase [Pseudomonadota bacterium]
MLIVLLTTLPSQASSLPASVTSLLKKYQVPADAVSLTVREVDAVNPLIAVNERVSRNPASAIKIVTTLAALELLGPHFQWQTRYFVNGPVVDGTVEGDLIVQGDGDPYLTVDKLWQHAVSLRLRGVHTIRGDLLIDNSAFSPPPHDRGAFDGQSQRLYNVGPSAVLSNFSATRFVIEPSAGRINVFADPPLMNLNVDNGLKPAKGKCISRNSGWSYELRRTADGVTAAFRGTYRPRCGLHSISRSVLENNEYTYQLFRYIWQQLGGFLHGGVKEGQANGSDRMLVSHPSDDLASVIKGINKYSNNVMARQLLLTMGHRESGESATVASGIAAIRLWLDASKLHMPSLSIDNGSGLSRSSRASTYGLSNLLVHAWKSTYQPEFMASLSLAALDGTMRKRLKKSQLAGRVRIKTGLIKGVRSMAGYVHTRSNRHVAVAMMIESSNVNYWIGNEIQDAVLRWVYQR